MAQEEKNVKTFQMRGQTDGRPTGDRKGLLNIQFGCDKTYSI